jgi:hypothetical protein
VRFDLTLQLGEPMSLFLEILFLALPRAIESTFHDERGNGVELAAIEECAVSPAQIDYRSRHTAEIHAVHHLPADEARTIMHGGLSC